MMYWLIKCRHYVFFICLLNTLINNFILCDDKKKCCKKNSCKKNNLQSELKTKQKKIINPSKDINSISITIDDFKNDDNFKKNELIDNAVGNINKKTLAIPKKNIIYIQKTDELCDFTILNYDEETIINIYSLIKYIFQYYLKNKTLDGCSKNISELEKKALGSMLGMLIGDSRGAPYEFVPVNKSLYDSNNYSKIDYIKSKISNKFDLEVGQWTDDSSMGLCIADSLIMNKGKLVPKDLMNRFLSWWYFGYNNGLTNDIKREEKTSHGLGGNISKSFNSYLRNPNLEKTTAGDEYTSGNGSIMRNAAIPICFHNNLDEALNAAENQSYVTHQGKEAAECCKLLTYIVYNILNNKDNKSLRDILDDIVNFKSDLESINGLINSKENVNYYGKSKHTENWNWKKSTFSYNDNRCKSSPGYVGSYAMDNMAMSLHILYYTNSFYQAIEVASKLCGDADSVASVVGQIAGAYYSLEKIPVEWIKNLLEWDSNYEAAIKAYILANLNN